MQNQQGSTSTDGGSEQGISTDDFVAKISAENSGPANQSNQGQDNNANEQENESAQKPNQPQDDTDGDSAFEKDFANFKMPEGLRGRLKTLTEQRNLSRTEEGKLKESLEKEYGYFKPYANDQGKKYLQMLVEFDSMLEKSSESNPWIADLIRDVVVEGKPADVKKLMAALGQARKEEESEEAPDPVNGKLTALEQRLERWENNQKQAQEQVKRRMAVDREKDTYRSDIAEWTSKNPQYKDDKNFTLMALQLSASSNSSFKDAAKQIHDYMSGKEKSKLTSLAKADGERSGAAVETPGRGGVPKKERPAFGSDEELEQMLDYFGAEKGN